MKGLLTVIRKELIDALRDRRTWMVVLITSVLTGPVLMVLLATTIGDLRTRAERREVMVLNANAAPRFVNFLKRQARNVVEPPADYEARIRAGRFDDAIIVIPADFSERLAAGGVLRVPIVHDANRSRSTASARAAEALVRGFSDEIATQRLLARGVAPALLSPVRVQSVDLGGSRGANAGLLFLVPFIAMFAALAGALTVSIDTTSGERERGSLEPLLMNPVRPYTIVTGKWVVAGSASVTTLALTLASFAVGARFINDEALAAVFQFGLMETGLFAVMLVPLCLLMAAFMMLTATFARTYKEAQAYTSYTMTGVAFVTAVPVYLALPDSPWQLLVPAMGQNMVLTRALRGAPVAFTDIALPGLIALSLTALLIVIQGRLLRSEKIIFAKG
ncbi:MAG TPA: ABC transporter permease [Burkholderiaceae bacterium]|nr:ABC transporter permease [Burkholderiaceae bacterium]